MGKCEMRIGEVKEFEFQNFDFVGGERERDVGSSRDK